jgi:soluble lytic murein transglycosylase-like protein
MYCAARTLRATLALGFFLSAAAPSLADTNAAIVPNLAYASLMRTINPRLKEDQSRLYATALLSDSRTMHVDPTLVMALVTVESGWNIHALSIHGAEGLGQIKPDTARILGVDPWSARSNLLGVTLYLHRLLGIFHEAKEPIREALAGYNAGPYAVKESGGAPPTSAARNYVVKVLNTWHTLRTRLGVAARIEAERASEVASAVTRSDPTTAIAKSEAAYWGVR